MLESNCPRPCKSFTVKNLRLSLSYQLTDTLFKAVPKLFDNHKFDISGLSIAINQKVEVTESYIPEFSITTFLAGLGGSLGLWLGVGAVQLLNLGVALLERFH